MGVGCTDVGSNCSARRQRGHRPGLHHHAAFQAVGEQRMRAKPSSQQHRVTNAPRRLWQASRCPTPGNSPQRQKMAASMNLQ
eukprot:15462525-Alexandrium_andersonii.AAC.1